MADTAEIPLAGGLVALVSRMDVDLVSRYLWHANVKPRTTYARTDIRASDGRWIKVVMHRLILDAPDGMEVGLDNRRENLRLATRRQNATNRRLGGDNTSGYKGVSWDTARGLWRARINVGGHKRHLGRYKDPWEAAQAYNAAALAEWGEFAHLNEETPRPGGERSPRVLHAHARRDNGSTPDSRAYELLRYDMSHPDPDTRSVQVLAVHAPIPTAALPALREELQGLCWWHRSADTWAAVMALHRADQHATAVELAQFLNWCDDGGPTADAAIFEIRPVASGSSITGDQEG